MSIKSKQITLFLFDMAEALFVIEETSTAYFDKSDSVVVNNEILSTQNTF